MAPPADSNGKGMQAQDPLLSPSARGAEAAGNDQVIDQIRQIIAAAPDVRPEKVGPIEEAVAQSTYEIDVRKLANILITELILKR